MARPQLWDLFALHPIADALFLYLTLADVYKLRRVCKPLQSVVLRLQDTHLNIYCALRDFLTRCEGFRYNLGRAGALLVGPFVVNFLGYRQHDSAFLDILVERGPLANNLIQYLCAEEAYQTVENSEASNLVVLSRPGFAAKIRVTKTEKAPIHTLLECSYTTLGLCFMSWNKLYSIFPLATLVHHEFWPLRKLDDAFGARLVELAALGWTTRDLIWLDLVEERLAGLGKRRVGDESSLVMPLVPALACPGVAPDYVLELSEFNVDIQSPVQHIPTFPRTPWPLTERKARELIITVKELKSQSLRYRYTTAQGSLWFEFALERLERWTEVELYKMDQDERPATFPELAPSSDFEVPATWDFADDQMPIWYQRCLSQNDPRKQDSRRQVRFPDPFR